MGADYDTTPEEVEEELLLHKRSAPQHQHRPGFTRRGAFLAPALVLLATLVACQHYSESLVAMGAEYSAPVVEQAPGYPQQPIDWREEDAELRNYIWTTPEPHASLGNILQSLDRVENQTRSWLLETRATSMAGVGVGLGRSEPPENLRAGAAAPAHAHFPRSYQGPGDKVYGSPAKYYELLEEWRNGRPLDVCKPDKWQDDYAKLHAEILSGEREPNLIQYHCGESCGGLADRLVGVMSIFLYGVISGRAMSVSWAQPCPFDLLFDSPYIDWSARFPNASSPGLAVYSQPKLIADRVNINAINWTPEEVDELFGHGILRRLWAKEEPWLRIAANRGAILRSFNYPSVEPRVQALGLRDSTIYSCLVNYLIRPKPAALLFINQYASLFSLPSVYSIGIQVRTGDASMRYPELDKDNTVAKFREYFKCAEQVSQTYAHPAQRIVYYLITDSHTLREDALQTFPGKLVVSGLDQSHMEIAAGSGPDGGSSGWSTRNDATDGMMRTISESWTFAATDFSILTRRSGFGKIPSWLRGKEGRVIQLFNAHLEPAFTNNFPYPRSPLDCTLDSALSTFSEMATDWSLG